MIKLPKIVPADATLKKLANWIGDPTGGYFQVTVTSPVMPGVSRVYTISARSDNIAALEGLRRFEEEFSQPPKLLVN